MAFYGKVTNVSKSQFSFDRTYPNRYEMDKKVDTDGVYIGRYVLVNYDDNDPTIGNTVYEGYKDVDNSTIKISPCFLRSNTAYNLETDTNKILPPCLYYAYIPDGSTTSNEKNILDNLTSGDIIRVSYGPSQSANFDSEKQYNGLYKNSKGYGKEQYWYFAGYWYYTRVEAPSSADFDKYYVYLNGANQFVKASDDGDGVYDANTKYFILPTDKTTGEVDTSVKTGMEIYLIATSDYSNEDNEDYCPNGGTAIAVDETTGAIKYDVVGTLTNSYLINFSIDSNKYGNSRGFDSTVWQKVSKPKAGSTGTYEIKYVNIAELNSVVPTFDVSSDAPTLTPQAAHWDANSNSTYYNLHVQPQWGLRVKSAKPLTEWMWDKEGNATCKAYIKATSYDVNEIYYKLTTEGYKVVSPSPGNEEEFNARTEDYYIYGSPEASYELDGKTPSSELPSDTETIWKRVEYNPKTNENYIYYMNYDEEDDVNAWIKDAYANNSNPPEIPAAIYWNNEGFDPEISTHSADKYANLETGIKVEPTGKSGRQYNQHANSDATSDYTAIDTQEMSIMLPQLGDAVADLWDIVYGEGKLNEDDTTDTNKYRNTRIDWDDNGTQEDSGLRLVNTSYDSSTGEYIDQQNTWSDGIKNVATLAGAINSADDAIGRNIVDVDSYLADLNIKKGYSNIVAGTKNLLTEADMVDMADNVHIYYMMDGWNTPTMVAIKDRTELSYDIDTIYYYYDSTKKEYYIADDLTSTNYDSKKNSLYIKFPSTLFVLYDKDVVKGEAISGTNKYKIKEIDSDKALYPFIYDNKTSMWGYDVENPTTIKQFTHTPTFKYILATKQFSTIDGSNEVKVQPIYDSNTLYFYYKYYDYIKDNVGTDNEELAKSLATKRKDNEKLAKSLATKRKDNEETYQYYRKTTNYIFGAQEPEYDYEEVTLTKDTYNPDIYFTKDADNNYNAATEAFDSTATYYARKVKDGVGYQNILLNIYQKGKYYTKDEGSNPLTFYLDTAEVDKFNDDIQHYYFDNSDKAVGEQSEAAGGKIFKHALHINGLEWKTNDEIPYCSTNTTDDTYLTGKTHTGYELIADTETKVDPSKSYYEINGLEDKVAVGYTGSDDHVVFYAPSYYYTLEGNAPSETDEEDSRSFVLCKDSIDTFIANPKALYAIKKTIIEDCKQTHQDKDTGTITTTLPMKIFQSKGYFNLKTTELTDAGSLCIALIPANKWAKYDSNKYLFHYKDETTNKQYLMHINADDIFPLTLGGADEDNSKFINYSVDYWAEASGWGKHKNEYYPGIKAESNLYNINVLNTTSISASTGNWGLLKFEYNNNAYTDIVEIDTDKIYYPGYYYYADSNVAYPEKYTLAIKEAPLNYQEGEFKEIGPFYFDFDGGEISSLYKVPNPFYKKDKYYILDGAEYAIDTSITISGDALTDDTHYTKNEFYVYKDGENIYDGVISLAAGDTGTNRKISLIGAEWSSQNLYVPSKITLRTRYEYTDLVPIEGFDRTYNTMHGLILKINQMLEYKNNDNDWNELTRDLSTVQGCINTLRDYICKFVNPTAGNVMVVDAYGRYHGAKQTTAQTYGWYNYGNKKSTVIDDGNTNASERELKPQEDQWIYWNVNEQLDEPLIKLQHRQVYSTYEESEGTYKVDYNSHAADKDPDKDIIIDKTNHKREDSHTYANKNRLMDGTIDNDSNTSSDEKYNTDGAGWMNEFGATNTSTDGVNLYTPIIDLAGHVVGANTEYVELPYGFKFITTTNTDSTLANGNKTKNTTLINDTNIKADNTQDTLNFAADNRWIKLGVTEDNHNEIVHIQHDTLWTPLGYLDNTNDNHSDLPYYVSGENDANANLNDSEDGTGNVSFTLESYRFDAAGHIRHHGQHTLTLPYGYSYIRTNKDSTAVDYTAPTSIANEATILSADKTKSGFDVDTGNRWIQVRTTESTIANPDDDTKTVQLDKLIIYHNAPVNETDYQKRRFGESANRTPVYTYNNGTTATESINIPYLGIDETGHVIKDLKHSTISFPIPTAINYALTGYERLDSYSTGNTLATVVSNSASYTDYTATKVNILATDNLKMALNKLEDKVDLLNAKATVKGSVAWQIDNLINSADGTLDTLQEISAWIKTSGAADLSKYKSLTELEQDFYGLDSTGKINTYASSSLGISSAFERLNYLEKVADLVVDNYNTAVTYINASTLGAYDSSKTYYMFENGAYTEYVGAAGHTYDSSLTYYKIDGNGDYVVATDVTSSNFDNGNYYLKVSDIVNASNYNSGDYYITQPLSEAAAESSFADLASRVDVLDQYTENFAEIGAQVQALKAEALHATQTLQEVQNSLGNMPNATTGYMQYYIGTEEPDTRNFMWIDNSDSSNILIKVAGEVDTSRASVEKTIQADTYDSSTTYYAKLASGEFVEAGTNGTTAPTSQTDISTGKYYIKLDMPRYHWYSINTWQ